MALKKITVRSAGKLFEMFTGYVLIWFIVFMSSYY